MEWNKVYSDHGYGKSLAIEMHAQFLQCRIRAKGTESPSVMHGRQLG